MPLSYSKETTETFVDAEEKYDMLELCRASLGALQLVPFGWLDPIETPSSKHGARFA